MAPENWARTVRTRVKDVSHDIRTPLNIAVLNIELLKMSLSGEDRPNQKRVEQCAAAERELRRIADILEAFFTVLRLEPTEGDESIGNVASEIAAELGVPLDVKEDGRVCLEAAHLKHLIRTLMEGADSAVAAPRAIVENVDGHCRLTLTGKAIDSAEIGKIFKFYYTDPSHNPRLELATARLMAEACGGSLELEHRENEIALILDMPGKA